MRKWGLKNKGGGVKYRNQKTMIDGFKFDSKLEASHYLILKQRLLKGEISNLARQVKIPLSENKKLSYIADFVFFDGSCWWVMDSKGFLTKEYKVKRSWLLDKFFGFKFLEKTAKGEQVFMPSGKTLLEFSSKDHGLKVP